MRRIGMIVVAIAFTLTMMGYVYSQSPTPKATAPKTAASKAAVPKVGKLLVKSLPARLEGVELKGATVRAKSGYKFVSQRNGTVTVARIAGGGGGGLGLGGTWSCSCVTGSGKSGTCTVTTTGSTVSCTNTGTDTCQGVCKLVVTTTGFTGGIMAY